MKKYILPTVLALLLIPSIAFTWGDSPFGPVPPDDTPYNAATWNGSLLAPTQNAVRDWIETFVAGGPAGVDTQVQYNDGGAAFGGDAGLTYVAGTDTLTVGNVSVVTTLNPSGGNTVDLGTSVLTYKNGFFSGTVAAPIYNAGVAGTQSGSVAVHDGGIVTIFDDGNDTSVILGPVNDGTTVLDVTGSIDADGLLVGGTAVVVTGGNIGDATGTGLDASGTVSANLFTPDAADGADIGTAALEFSDVYLADGSVIYFGNDQDVTLTHTPDAGLTLNLSFIANGTLHGGVEIIDDDNSLSAAQCRGSLNKLTGAETTTLPAATVGMSVLLYSEDATVKTIDPDGTENIWLNGVDNGDGNSINSPGAIGDFIVLVAFTAGNWYSLGQSGVWIDTP